MADLGGGDAGRSGGDRVPAGARVESGPSKTESPEDSDRSLGACELIGRRPTLPRTRARSTIGAEGLNCRVRDGNGCDPFAKITQKSSDTRWCTHFLVPLLVLLVRCIGNPFYGQAERAISTG